MSTPTSWTLNLQYLMQGRWSRAARVNQQPPVHQFRMRLFKLFWRWTTNTTSSPAQGFFSPLLCPKIFPTYLPHLISRSLHRQSLEELPIMSSSNLRGDARHKAWGRWRRKGKRSASSQMQNWEKKGKLLPFSAFFFPLCFLFFSSTWEEEDDGNGRHLLIFNT